MAERKLTDQQWSFIREYHKSGNAYKSAIAAGYSEAYARGSIRRLLDKASVQEALQALYNKDESEAIADATELQKILTAIAREQQTDEQLVQIYDKDLKAMTIEHDFTKSQTRDRLKAIELLGRMGGMFTSQAMLEISGQLPVVIKDDIK